MDQAMCCNDDSSLGVIKVYLLITLFLLQAYVKPS